MHTHVIKLKQARQKNDKQEMLNNVHLSRREKEKM